MRSDRIYRRNGGEVAASEALAALTSDYKEVWFSECEIVGDLDIRDAGIEPNGDERFTMKSEADFSRVLFHDNVCFADTTFAEAISFTASTFNGAAVFARAFFHNVLDLTFATFNGPADFAGATFDEIQRIKAVTFNGDARFVDAIFQDGLIFVEPAFNRATDIERATFRYPPRFDAAAFGDDIDRTAFLEAHSERWRRR